MIGYIARDKNGDLYLYTDKPVRKKNAVMWLNSGPGDFLYIGDEAYIEKYKDLKFEDEPIKVHITIMDFITVKTKL